MLTYFPRYFSDKAIGLYVGLLCVNTLLFYSYAMTWYWWLFGAVEVVGFFYFSNLLSHRWGGYSPGLFKRKLFGTALGIRLVYVLFSYLFYCEMTGTPFEFNAGDVGFYNELGRYGASLLLKGEFNLLEQFMIYTGGVIQLSDSGYPIYLSIVYALTDNSILITRLIKAVLSAYTVWLVYKLAARNFDEPVARMGAIFCMLMPNLVYYCGLHLKETEMLFLTVLFVERADALLRSSKLVAMPLVFLLMLGMVCFTFRTVLGVVLVLALMFALVLTSKRVVRWGKRVIILLLSVAMLGVALSDRIALEVEQLWDARADNQSTSMQWRAEREQGNKFAKYAGAAVFAPLIFTIPFPTMVETVGQENQRLIHGGNYVKNIVSFFTILALVLLLFSGQWRRYVLMLAFMLGYLVVIALSAFAHSERFHLPALPFLLLFAAYGVSQMRNSYKRYFVVWLVFIFVANVAWAWFKLAGRGLV